MFEDERSRDPNLPPELWRHWDRTHAALQKNYGDEPGTCLGIALDLVRLLRDSDRQPQLARLKGELIPKKYGGRVAWGTHFVCIDRDVAYDPMLAEPTDLMDYLQTTFRQRPDVTELLGDDEIEAHIQLLKSYRESTRKGSVASLITKMQKRRRMLPSKY